MGRKTQKQSVNPVCVKDYVTVAFAEDPELAREYLDLLERHEIAAVVKKQPNMSANGFSDIAIMVPEDCLDEAHCLIARQAAYDDFFDAAFNSDFEEYDITNDFQDDDEF